jgi:hypothetical protein
MKKLIIIGLTVILIISLSINVMGAYQRIMVKQEITNHYQIIVDKETGVNYLEYHGYGGAYGITVMYNSKGSILIDK